MLQMLECHGSCVVSVAESTVMLLRSDILTGALNGFRALQKQNGVEKSPGLEL